MRCRRARCVPDGFAVDRPAPPPACSARPRWPAAARRCRAGTPSQRARSRRLRCAPPRPSASAGPALTARRRTPGRHDSSAFIRRILRAYSRRVGVGDVQALALMLGLADEIDTAIAEAIKGRAPAAIPGPRSAPGSASPARPLGNAGDSITTPQPARLKARPRQAGERCHIDRNGVKRRTGLPAKLALSSALGSPRSLPETDPVAKIASPMPP